MTDSAGTTRPVPISVVTAVLNGASHLEQCLRSVAHQIGTLHEHLVIDGGSVDGSLAIVQRHRDRLQALLSEPDQGIGDAMNKGLKLARGEWLLFLHADDHLRAPDVLAQCWRILEQSQADVVGFPIEFGQPGRSRRLQPRGGTTWLNLKTGLLHQATFIRRSLFERIGPYDLRYRIAMDYEFFLRAWRRGARFEIHRAPIPTFMRDQGISSRQDWRSQRRRFDEERRIHEQHAEQRPLLRLGYRLYWPAYLGYRQLRQHLIGRERHDS